MFVFQKFLDLPSFPLSFKAALFVPDTQSSLLLLLPTTRPNFSQPSCHIALIYQSVCSCTIVDRLLYDWIAEKNWSSTYLTLPSSSFFDGVSCYCCFLSFSSFPVQNIFSHPVVLELIFYRTTANRLKYEGNTTGGRNFF